MTVLIAQQLREEALLSAMFQVSGPSLWASLSSAKGAI
jgi:hypothetical protein